VEVNSFPGCLSQLLSSDSSSASFLAFVARRIYDETKSMQTLAVADVEAMIRILSRAGDPTVEMSLVDRKRAIMEGIVHLIAADAWVWMIGRVNPELPGDSMATSIVDGGWRDDCERAEVFRIIVHPDLQRVVTQPLHWAVLEDRSLTHSREELVGNSVWNGTNVSGQWRAAGFDDLVISVYPVGEYAFSAAGFYRRLGNPAFDDRDKAILHIMFQQIDWLHRQGSNVAASDKVIDLSPRERQVMLLLLGGDSRKQVAAKLQLSQHTVADYLKEIYRKLGVSSRAELLSKFIPGGKQGR
jgi:DNA-binding CsgD family transcriptional regulator